MAKLGDKPIVAKPEKPAQEPKKSGKKSRK